MNRAAIQSLKSAVQSMQKYRHVNIVAPVCTAQASASEEDKNGIKNWQVKESH